MSNNSNGRYARPIHSVNMDQSGDNSVQIGVVADGGVVNVNMFKAQNSFANKIESIKERNKNHKNPFHYLNANLGFYGREKEIELFHSFLGSKDTVATLDSIEKRNPTVNKLFYVFAYADTNSIPLDVFAEHRSLMPDDMGKMLSDRSSIDDMVVFCGNFHLLSVMGATNS